MPPTDPVLYETSLLTDHDLYLFHEGTHTRLYEKLGAHPGEVLGAAGTFFAVWAPDAARVAVMGDFNGWSKDSHPLRARGSSGVWEGFVPGVGEGAVYKYFIASRHGAVAEKADPMALRTEVPPRTASIVHALGDPFAPRPWREKRRRNAQDAPMSIYELHLASWRRVPEDGNRSLTYLELARELPDYASRLGFTHVEILPIMEHPFGGSWGYQVTGFFAPTSRLGTPEDFMKLIDALHERGLGVILDWVPSHFPTDAHGLSFFDGTHLYEHADPRKGFHPDWKTSVFNLSRHEVRSFLLSSATIWLDRYKVDGLRVDAVASMLYLDYSRKEGEWIPNIHGGRENLEAITFLRALNERVFAQFPEAQTIAEESTSWPMVSRPVYLGGLGFGMKWDMGWMNDTLRYMARPTVFRKFHHNELTFRMMYAFSESFVLPLSHDEVVHGKGSLYEKMPGDEWQKMANLRLLLGYMWGQPGKKLLFMGGEIAQKKEWNHDASVDWHLLEQGPYHAGVSRWVTDLNRLYRETAAMHEQDALQDGFRWIDCNDADQSTLIFHRRAKKSDETVAIACNFTPVPRTGYRMGVPRGGTWTEALNSDAAEYGGSGTTAGAGGTFTAEPIPWHGQPFSIEVTLPPLGSVYFIHRGIAVSDRPLGAVYAGEGRTRFRLWAPNASRVEVRLLGEAVSTLGSPRLEPGHPTSAGIAPSPASGAAPTSLEGTAPKSSRYVVMTPEENGYHHATIGEVYPGARYVYRVDGVDLPDPASRHQPEGVTGPSAVSAAHVTSRWFSPRPLAEQVIYEVHIGTFTGQGTFDAAIARLGDLVDLGITTVELLPVSEFPGGRNWGYDGVFPYAVQSTYGGPEGLARFVDACHARGLAVLLDVVYNHLGPEGALLEKLGPYFSDRYRTPWGAALNFDGPQSDEVRKLFLESALHFVTDLGIDGLRLDAVSAMIDTSPRPFLEELGDAVRRRAADLGKKVHLIAEGDTNDPRLVEPPARGGLGLDAMWSDDFHHALHALVTGERTGYYADYGSVEQLARAMREGFAFTGEPSVFRKRRHGRSAAHLAADAMVVFAQNHDQVGNRLGGERLMELCGFEKAKLAAAAVLLSPYVPLLFMGEEYADPAPFHYFTSHADAGLAASVKGGRAATLASLGFTGALQDPQDAATFEGSRLRPELAAAGVHAATRRYYKRILDLRRGTPALARGGKQALSCIGFAHEKVLVLRRWHEGSEVLALFAFGAGPVQLTITVPNGRWERVLDSADPMFDGPGAASPSEIRSWGSARVHLGPSAAAVYVRTGDP